MAPSKRQSFSPAAYSLAAKQIAKIPFSASRQTLAFPFQHSRLVPAGGTETNDPTKYSCCDSCNLLGYLPQALHRPLTIAYNYLM